MVEPLSREAGVQSGLALLETVPDKAFATLVEGILRLLAKDAHVNEADLAGTRSVPRRAPGRSIRRHLLTRPPPRPPARPPSACAPPSCPLTLDSAVLGPSLAGSELQSAHAALSAIFLEMAKQDAAAIQLM